MEKEMELRLMRLGNRLRGSDGDRWGWLRFGTILCKPLKFPLTSENSIQTSLSHDISLQKRAKLALLLLVLYFMLILIEQNLKPGITYDALQQLDSIDKWQWKWGYLAIQPPLYHWLFKILSMYVVS